MQGFHNLTETATNLRGASATLRFNGSQISYYGNYASWGSQFTIDLDGERFNASSVRAAQGERRQTLLWQHAGLDASVEHTLTVRLVGGAFLDVDRVDVVMPDTPTSGQTVPESEPEQDYRSNM